MITFNEKEVEVSQESTGYDLIEQLNQREPHQACALFVNGIAKDFSTTLKKGDRVEICPFDDPRGKEVFWHSSAHVLAQAILRLFPDAQPTIGPPIENGFYYDFANLHLSEEDFPNIEKEAQKIIGENAQPKLYTFSSKEEALEAFKDNPFKVELINEFKEDSPITGYKQGEFFDLCRGPHLPQLGKIKAFKCLKTSAAYWRGDQNRETLTRVYAITFPDRKLLKEYLTFLEEAKKRDHRVIGQKLGFFHFFDVAPGMPLIKPHGMILWNKMLDFWRALHTEAGYTEIKSPVMMDRSLWEQSGHWENYRENMYVSEIDERVFALKPMNCPACMLYYASYKHSYRDLPLRIGEIGNVHRHELSGSLSGLLRVRCFHQDDAHIFMKPDDIEEEIIGVLKLVDQLYTPFGLNYHLELSTRPESKTIGSDEDWAMTTAALRSALTKWGRDYKVNEGDGAFYGPKIDIHVQDTLKRSWQCGTIQLDMSLPERFNLEYRDSDGSTKRPIMIHRALYGSIERFMAIIIEHFAGRFPFWLNPRQIRVIPVADRHIPFSKEVQAACRKRGLLCDIDTSNESVSKKIRLAQMEQVNYMITLGDQECEEKTLSLRTRSGKQHKNLLLDHFLKQVIQEQEEKCLQSPFEKEEICHP